MRQLHCRAELDTPANFLVNSPPYCCYVGYTTYSPCQSQQQACIQSASVK